MSYEGDGSMCALASGALVGKESCLGGFACTKRDGSKIGTGSCQGYISCYARVYYDEEAEGRYSDGPGGNIGDGSCNSIFSCGAFWGTVGNDSCNTFGVEELSEICTSLRKAGALPYTVDNAAAGVGATSRYELDNPYIGKKSSMQRRRHYELLASQVEMEGKERMDKLKKELEMRSVVLREQVSHGKKFLAASGGGRANATGSAGAAGGVGGVGGATRPMLPSHNKNVVSKNASNQFRSPLFTMTASGNMPSSNTSSLTTKTTSSAPSSVSNGPLAASATRTSRPPPASASITSSGYSSYGGYGGSSSYAGYGGASNSANNNNTQQPSFSTGMRQRKQQPQKSTIQIDNGADDKYNKSTDGESSDIQQQIQTRRQNRQTQSRLASARLAEKSIAELGTMFTKMSTLISQQGEMLERIEDDVEAAGGDIDAGHEELVKVYGMTKGNRALILKVFGILIGLIIFMKLY
eukprot:g5329.t1 g5329   contig2:284721-286302(-)